MAPLKESTLRRIAWAIGLISIALQVAGLVILFLDRHALGSGLSARDGGLTFEVTDDGRGFDAERTPLGSGMQNMADRLAALDGSLEVRSRPGEGATVMGRLPVGPSAP